MDIIMIEKKYMENIFIENGKTMFFLHFKKEKMNEKNVQTNLENQ